MAEAPVTTRFFVKGMDCASCVSKIETAVRRIPGASDVRVGLQSETLSVQLQSEEAKQAVRAAVRSLGYDVSDVSPGGVPPAPSAHHHPDGDGHDHRDHDHGAADHADDAAGHSDHGEAIEGAWWRSQRGLLVLATGALIGLAYAANTAAPRAGMALFLLACAVGTAPVALRALTALRYGSVFTIEMLMTIAVAGALWLGAVEEAAIVVALFAVGELLEGVAAGRARSGIKALATLAPNTALVETVQGVTEQPISGIAIGSIIVVRPGDRIAADGTIVSGTSSVDQSALTGESLPLTRGPGEAVFAGSINAEAVLRVRVDKPAQDTLIARVARLVEEAADAKAPSQRFIDQFAKWYMPLICILALAVAVLPPLGWGEAWPTWIYRGLTLLLIGCPCALVISTPASIASSLAAGARRGLLVKGGGVLEAIGKVQQIAFDKTGTLTRGTPVVTDVVTLAGDSEKDILRLAATVESASSHPLAVAIVARARDTGIVFDTVPSVAVPGKGISATVEGKNVMIGAAARIGITAPDILARAAALEAGGKSVSAILVNGTAVGLIALRDEPREDAVEGIRRIRALGLRPVMLTGDNRANAEAVGALLGMEVRAELLPEDKLAVIRERAALGGIAKVGDGINDAPALAAATVGIAMGSGTDVALEAADAAVLNNRVGDVATLISLSRQTMSVIRQNVALALGLKGLFLVTTVIGATGLWIAILADTGATVLVTLNALRLLRMRIP